MRPEVAVVHNSSNVIKDKVTGQWVPIHDCAQQEEPRVYQCSSSIEDRGSIFGSLIIRSISGGWAMTISRWSSTMWLVLWMKNLVVVVVVIVIVIVVVTVMVLLRRRLWGPPTIGRGWMAFEAVMPHASSAWQKSDYLCFVLLMYT